MIQNDQRRGPLPSEIYATQSADRMAKWRKEGLEETAQIREKLRSSPAEPGLYAELANQYNVLGDQDAAAAVLREGIAACGSAADLYWKLITMLQEAGRNEDAIALATSAIRKAPKGL